MTCTDATIDRLRRRVLTMIAETGSGHPGSSLSCLHCIAVLYFDVMQGVVEHARDRDRFVLSKGHAAPALYAVLEALRVLELGPKDRLREVGSVLQGHPDKARTRGIEASSGSLGQGLSIGVGMALELRRRHIQARTFVLLGDGELQEGQNWEAAGAAAHFGVDSLTAIVDRNGHQHDGPTEDVLALGALADRWRSFGWQVTEVDGHSLQELRFALTQPASRPTAVIAHTVKAHGVPFMQWPQPWHSVRDAAELSAYASTMAGVHDA